jgi:hypothetical protein
MFPSFPRYKEGTGLFCGTGGRGQIEPGPTVTRLSQGLLPNVVLKFYQIGFFFTKHVQIPRFEISGCVQPL